MSSCHPLEVVGRGSDTQLQVGDNLKYLFLAVYVNYEVQPCVIIEVRKKVIPIITILTINCPENTTRLPNTGSMLV